MIDASTDVMRLARIATLEEARDSASRRGSRARMIAKLLLMIVLVPIAWPLWAVRCWWDLHAEDQRRAERARQRISFGSVAMGRGEPRVPVRTAERQ